MRVEGDVVKVFTEADDENKPEGDTDEVYYNRAPITTIQSISSSKAA